MTIRAKLLLLPALTLVLPWAGCQYAREMETVLRESEQQSLRAIASSIASSLQGRDDLLYRGQPPRAEPDARDVDVLPLNGPPYLDGLVDDWVTDASHWRRFRSPDGDELRFLVGRHEQFLYVFATVADKTVVQDRNAASALDAGTLGDRLWIGFDDPAGRAEEYFVAGLVGAGHARHIEARDYGRKVAVDESRIDTVWRPTDEGYSVELRMPASMVGRYFGLLVDDREQRGAKAQSYGSLDAASLEAGGRLVMPAGELEGYLAQFREPGMRISFATPQGAVLAEPQATLVNTDYTLRRTLLARLYRRMLRANVERLPKARSSMRQLADEDSRSAAKGEAASALLRTGDRGGLVVAASAPVRDGNGRDVIGVLRVVQTADRWLILRDRALSRLLNLTLSATLLALLATLGFATWLGLRLTRLARATQNALDTRGNLDIAAIPDQQAGDELGGVARSFARLLRRQMGYTQYLRTLAGKLAHEIRTPLAIVRSSLDNLQSEAGKSEVAPYIERANQGIDRLGHIVSAMGAAGRLEDAIAQAEKQPLDLAQWVPGALAGYRLAFAQHRFGFTPDADDSPLAIMGSAELIGQMLDKLIENAVDFAPPGSEIAVGLTRDGDHAVLSVANHGQPLPAGAENLLFESMWQSRPDSHGGQPHFGLGLYIVKQVAEFHGGSATASNRGDGRGVVFRIDLGPLLH
ncbi:MAG: ATP-binding protein [Steroidobacteraceae bacterium]